MTEAQANLFQSFVTALITIAVLGVMAYGAVTGVDVGVFSEYGGIVIGYYFGARAQGAVAKAADSKQLPSVL